MFKTAEYIKKEVFASTGASLDAGRYKIYYTSDGQMFTFYAIYTKC